MNFQTIYIGTYTEKLPFVDGKAEGIYVCHLDMNSGKLAYMSNTIGPRNPSYLAIDPQQQFIYANQETEIEDAPKVHALVIDEDTLQSLNDQPGHGGLPCHITVDKTGRFVLSANYETGSIVCYPIQEDGSLGKATAFIQHQGSGSTHPRQLAPHAHAVVLSTDNRLLFVPDLGLDKILVYRFDDATGDLIPSDPPFVKTHTGAGPRHFVFHPSNQYAFTLNEMDATIIVYAYHNGLLNPLQTISTLPVDTNASPSCAEIAVTPDGRYVYASNRGHNSLARFSFETGQLTELGYTHTLGETPRDFAIDPTGTFLIVGNQDTDTVVTFRIDHQTGDLEATGFVAEIPNPVCILPIQS